jgi:hypothetical protein
MFATRLRGRGWLSERGGELKEAKGMTVGPTYQVGGGGLAKLLDCFIKLDDLVFLQEAINSKFNLKNRGCWSCML